MFHKSFVCLSKPKSSDSACLREKNESATVNLAAISFSCFSFDVGGNVFSPLQHCASHFFSFFFRVRISLFLLLLFAVDVQCALGQVHREDAPLSVDAHLEQLA